MRDPVSIRAGRGSNRTTAVCRGVGIAAVAALALAGCASTNTAASDTAASGRAGAPADGTNRQAGSGGAELVGTVTVLAAASLTESFDQVKADFEAAHPGVTVEVSYGSSATLVQQVNGGAPADVIALAGESAAKPLDQKLVRASAIFATNRLEIAVPPSNPGKITGLADFAKPHLRLVVCEASVPCGKAATATFGKAKVNPSIDSYGTDVKATLTFVEQGEADGAIVYQSDVASARGKVVGVPIPDAVNTSLRYPIISLDDRAATKALVAYVTSTRGAATVAAFGLGAP